MKKGDLFYSAVQFLFSVGIALLGIFCIGFHYAPHLRQPLADFAISSSLFLSVGCAILGVGLLLLVGFYFMYRRVYYRFSMGTRETLVDPQIIRKYVEQYWEEQIPDGNTRVEILLGSQQEIEIYLEWDNFSFEVQKALLENAEKELTTLLRRQFGYSKQFSLSILT